MYCPGFIGVTAVVAQIVLLRELMVVFSGAETALGIALAWRSAALIALVSLAPLARPRRRESPAPSRLNGTTAASPAA